MEEVYSNVGSKPEKFQVNQSYLCGKLKDKESMQKKVSRFFRQVWHKFARKGKTGTAGGYAMATPSLVGGLVYGRSDTVIIWLFC